MRRKTKITMIATESAAETYERFLLTKRANGVKTKTIETYSQHFHAISKHLDISQEVAEMTATDLKEMDVSMQESGLSPNSISKKDRGIIYRLSYGRMTVSLVMRPILFLNREEIFCNSDLVSIA